MCTTVVNQKNTTIYMCTTVVNQKNTTIYRVGRHDRKNFVLSNLQKSMAVDALQCSIKEGGCLSTFNWHWDNCHRSCISRRHSVVLISFLTDRNVSVLANYIGFFLKFRRLPRSSEQRKGHNSFETETHNEKQRLDWQNARLTKRSLYLPGGIRSTNSFEQVIRRRATSFVSIVI